MNYPSSTVRRLRAALIAALGLSSAPAFALGGDFNGVDFAASAPKTYNHDTGGGAFDFGAIGKTNDVVESLEGGDFACGDIVTYLVAFNMATAPVEARQTAQFQLSFLADTTGQSGAAHVQVVQAKVNYGTVQCAPNLSCAAGPGGTDAGIVDDHGSTATLLEQHFENGTGPFTQASELVGTFQLDDLEAGEQVIVRIDTRIGCKPGTSPTGNLQAEIRWVKEVSPTADIVNAGNQTIPFKQIGDMAGAGTPMVRVLKTVTSADGSCPGSEQISAVAGDLVKYCYTVRNDGTANLLDLSLKDDNGTPSNLADDFLVPLFGLKDLDKEVLLDDLASGASAQGSAIVAADMRAGSLLTNIATAKGSDNKNGAYTDSDTASVIVTQPPASLSLVVKASYNATCGDADDMDVLLVATGSTVYYCYTVTNTGATSVSNITVNDSIATVPGSLNLLAGASATLISAPLTANTILIDSAVAAGSSNNTAVTSNSDSAEVDVAKSALAISVQASLDPVCGNADDTSALTVITGTTVYWCYTIVNTGDTSISGASLLDENGAPLSATIVSGDANLLPGESVTLISSAGAIASPTVEQAVATGLDIFSFVVDSQQAQASATAIAPALSIAKTASLDGSCPGSESVTALVGQSVTWCYTVTNTGDVAISNVTISDGDQLIAIGNLAAGASTSASATFAATGDFSSAATASGNDAVLGLPVSSQPDAASVDVIHPSLSIQTTVSLNGSCPGSEVVNVLANTAVTWCFLVTNTGDTAISQIAVTDSVNGTLLTGITSLSAGESAYLSAADVASLSVIDTASATGTTTATGTSVSSAQDPAAVNVVHPGVQVNVTVSLDGSCPGADSQTVVSGTSVTYCYTVSNPGDTTLQNVVLTDAAGNVIGTIASIAPGGSATISAPATTILQDTTASVSASGNDVYGNPVSASDTALIDATFANLMVTKTAPAQVILSATSHQLTYTITVSNNGDAVASNAKVTDVLPAGLSYVSATSTVGTCSASGSTVICSLGDFAPGASATISVVTNITVGFATITNTASAATVTPETNLADNSASATTAVASATRTIGFYGTHPTFTQQCLTSIGGVINLGYVSVGNEAYDNQYDVDTDTRIELGLNLALGVFNANVAKFKDGSKRSALQGARAQAGRQVLAAICNASLLGAIAPFDFAAARATLAGSNTAAILALSAQADAFNNAGDMVPSFGDPGPANSSYPWDDPTDPRD